MEKNTLMWHTKERMKNNYENYENARENLNNSKDSKIRSIVLNK
jgi:hypothetical protein